jgi:uncharacterized tellurite resistance protein B-like protein
MNDKLLSEIEHHFLSAIVERHVESKQDRLDFVSRFGMLLMLVYADGELDRREIASIIEYCQNELAFLSHDEAKKIVDECIAVLKYGFNIEESLLLFCDYLNSHKTQAEKLLLIQALHNIAMIDHDFGTEEQGLIQRAKKLLQMT